MKSDLIWWIATQDARLSWELSSKCTTIFGKVTGKCVVVGYDGDNMIGPFVIEDTNTNTIWDHYIGLFRNETISILAFDRAMI